MYKKRQTKKTRNIKKKFNHKTRKTSKTRKNKFSRRTKYRTRKNRGGMSGITIKKGFSKKKAFDFFIENSVVEYVSKGGFGITFKAKLNPEFTSKSPYKSTDSATYGLSISTILFKLVFLYSSDNSESNLSKQLYIGIDDADSITVRKEELSNFYGEINIQEDVYFKTMDYLEPICPAIVYSNVYTASNDINKLKLLEQIMKSTTSGSYTFKLLQGLIKSEKFIGSIGVVAMEFADEYRTLYSFEISKYDYPKDVKAAAMYLILELAIKTGYSHADFHGGNIMILKVPLCSDSALIKLIYLLGGKMAISNMEQITVENKPVVFEFAMKELQQIVSQLDAGQLGLSESLACFERGTNLLRQCQQELDAAERKIEILTGFNAEGEPITEPFEATDSLESREQKAGRRKASSKKSEAKLKTQTEADSDVEPREKKLLF
jgi:exodeoxyribonuclease VII small subunit